MTKVSIIITCYNLQDDIEKSVRSVLDQTDIETEVIIIDDASTDKTPDILKTLKDDCLNIIQLDKNRGPAAARNTGLKAAKGEWISILDGDDTISPERLHTLIQLAKDKNADIVCDNPMLVNRQGEEIAFLFPPDRLPENKILTAEDVLKYSNLGYLKPVIKTSLIREYNLQYDEGLRIGEDYHFLLDALLTGAKCFIGPPGGYFYTRHEHSISYRSNLQNIEKLIQKSLKLQQTANFPGSLTGLLSKRIKQLKNWLAYEKMVINLKQGKIQTFITNALQTPDGLIYFADPVSKRIKRLFGKAIDKPRSI